MNNLLSREDDDGEGSHDEASGGLIASGGVECVCEVWDCVCRVLSV